MGIRRDYQREQQRALGAKVYDMIVAGRSATDTARDLGISRSRLYRALRSVSSQVGKHGAHLARRIRDPLLD